VKVAQIICNICLKKQGPGDNPWMHITMESGGGIDREFMPVFIYSIGSDNFHICSLRCLGKFIDELIANGYWSFERKEKEQ